MRSTNLWWLLLIQKQWHIDHELPLQRYLYYLILSFVQLWIMHKKVFRVCGKPSTVMSESNIKVFNWRNCNLSFCSAYPYLPLGKRHLNCCTFIDNVTSLCSCTLEIFATFSSRSQSSRVFIKHIQLHAKSKPWHSRSLIQKYGDSARYTKSYITTTEPKEKNNNRKRIFNGRAKPRFNLTIQVASVGMLIQFGVSVTFEVHCSLFPVHCLH